MNPYKLKDVFNYLTSNNQLLKRKLKLGTSEIPIPPKRQDVIDIEAINRFNKDNPRVDATDIQPVVKQSTMKQSNVGEVDEGVIQGAFDTATREAQQSGYPAPSYEKFKSRYLKRNMKADGGRIGYKDGLGPNDQPMGPVYTTNKIEDAAKEVVKRLIKLDGVDIPLTDKISMSLGPNLNQTEIRGVIDILGGELNFGGGLKGDDKGIGFSFRKEFQDGGMLVQPNADGSRPGYAGPKKDSDVIAKKIDEVNKGLKFYTYDSLAKEIPGFNSGSNLQIYIKNNNLSKLDTFPKKVEKAWISLFEDGDKAAQTVYKPLFKIRELVGGGQKDYGTGATKRTRTEHISKALKESDLLVWDDIKPIISKLNSDNFINSLDRKGIDYTIADVEYSAYNKTGMLRAPKTDAEHLMDYVIRHVNQSDSPVYSIYDSKTNKRITDLKNVDSYNDIYFKSESPFKDTTNYDMEYLKTKARKDPLFKEYFNLQDELFEMKNKEYWPDGSRIIDPKTGKGTTFGNWSGSLNKHGYGYTKSFERFPYDTDHKFGVAKHPFKDLAILPQRINIALGSVMQKNRGDLSKKIGADYFRNLSVDDLMMQEKEFGKKILIFDADGNHIGKKSETPYQNAKRIVKYYNDLDLSKAGKGPKPEFPLSDFQKPDQAVPIKKRLETFKNKKQLSISLELLKASNPEAAKKVDILLGSGFPVNKIAEELVKIPGVRQFRKAFTAIGGPIGAAIEAAFAFATYNNEISKGTPHATALEIAQRDASFGLAGEVDQARMTDLTNAGQEIGVNTTGFQELKTILDLEKKIEREKALLQSYNQMEENFLPITSQEKEKGFSQDFDFEQQENKIADLESQYRIQATKLRSSENFDTLFQDYNSAVEYLARKQYNKVVDVKKNQVYPNQGKIGSDFTAAFFDPIKSYLPQNLMETGLSVPTSLIPGINKDIDFSIATRPYVRAAQKIPFIGDFFKPTSDAAKLSAMSQEEKNQRALDMNIVKQNYHPVMGTTMRPDQMEEYYANYFSKGGIASLTDTIPPESGPTPHGLPYVYNNVKKI